MPRRNGSVHVATTRRTYKGKVYETHLLRRTYREGGKVRHQTLGNLSHLPPDLINTIRTETPAIWDTAFKDRVIDLIKKAVVLEQAYARDACPEGLLGINADQFSRYVEHIADRRLERLTLPKLYNRDNPFPWMSQSTDLSKEKNFFETRVTEYQSGGSLTWD